MKRPSTPQLLTLLAIAAMLSLPLVSLVMPIPSTRIEGMPRGARLPAWSIKSAKAGKYQS